MKNFQKRFKNEKTLEICFKICYNTHKFKEKNGNIRRGNKTNRTSTKCLSKMLCKAQLKKIKEIVKKIGKYQSKYVIICKKEVIEWLS